MLQCEPENFGGKEGFFTPSISPFFLGFVELSLLAKVSAIQGTQRRRDPENKTLARFSEMLKYAKTTNDMDRLSSLPDAILSHILTFLPEKDAVATSILCKRWKSVYLHVQEVKLDDVFLQNPRKKSAKSCSCPKSETSYIDYANRLLLLASGMRTFRLRSVNLDVPSVSNLWIRSSLTRNIQELDIKADSGRIPLEIFSCNSLVVLKLEGRAELEVPKFVSLPNLKVMQLKLLTMLGDNDSPWEICVGYPHLEELQVYDITTEGVYSIRISIPTLQKLSVNVTWDDNIDGQIVLSAPDLCHLELEAGSLLSESPVGYGLLGKLKVLKLRGDYDSENLESILQNAPNLERLICNVFVPCKGFDEDAGHNCRIMQQLREVEVRDINIGCFDSGLQTVLYFLKHGVVLKKMTIVESYGHNFREVFRSNAFKKLLLQESCSPAVQLFFRSIVY